MMPSPPPPPFRTVRRRARVVRAPRGPSGVALAALGLLAGALAACGAGGPTATDDVTVVATTSILGDVVADVVGDAGTVSVLMDQGQDPHTFQLSARQAAELGDVDLVVANGLGLEAGITEALEQAAAAGVEVLEVAPSLDPLPAGDHDEGREDDADHDDSAADQDEGHEGDADHDDSGEDHDESAAGDDEVHTADDGHDHGPLDPHVWLDVDRMARVPALVAAALDDVAPGQWGDRATEVGDRLADLDRSVADRVATIPPACRRVASTHDSLRYLADRYDLDVAVTLVPGTSTEVEPSARDLARAADEVDDLDVPALVVEDTSGTRLADTLADEVEGDLEVLVLPLSTLDGPSGVGSYDEMMHRVVDELATALADC